MNRDLLDRLLAARHDRRAVALVTDLETGAQRLVGEDDAPEDVLSAALLSGFRFDRSGVTETEEGEFFVNIYNPPLKLVIVGAVHIAQSLIPIARLAGYDVTVIDPRGAFASAERFPDVTLSAEWPDEALKPSSSTGAPPSSPSPTTPRSTTPPSPPRCRAPASTSARWARRRPTPGASNG
jgi:xanthine dehydrogenase accessory factor